MSFGRCSKEEKEQNISDKSTEVSFEYLTDIRIQAKLWLITKNSADDKEETKEEKKQPVIKKNQIFPFDYDDSEEEKIETRKESPNKLTPTLLRFVERSIVSI